jgi:hypothetical protein
MYIGVIAPIVKHRGATMNATATPMTSTTIDGLTYWIVTRADGTIEHYRCDEDIARLFHGR